MRFQLGFVITAVLCTSLPLSARADELVVGSFGGSFADNVKTCHVAAFEKAKPGERYILGGENLPLQQMLADIAQMTGRKAPTIALPRWPLYPLALGAEAVAKFTKKEPFVTVDGLRMSKNKMYFTSAKAERELGYRARPYREGLRDALDWFGSAGYLK